MARIQLRTNSTLRHAHAPIDSSCNHQFGSAVIVDPKSQNFLDNGLGIDFVFYGKSFIEKLCLFI